MIEKIFENKVSDFIGYCLIGTFLTVSAIFLLMTAVNFIRWVI